MGTGLMGAEGIAQLTVKGIKIGEKNGILRAVFCFSAGLLSSRAIVFGKCAPFGVAAVAAVKQTDGIFVLLGVVIGSLAPFGVQYGVRYVAAAAAVFAFKWLMSGFEELNSRPLFEPVTAATALLATGAAAVLASGRSGEGFLLLAAETLLCGCMVYFFRSVLRILDQGGVWGIGTHELVSLVITLCVGLVALAPLGADSISVGRIAGMAAVMAASCYWRETGGAITGISVGISLALGTGPGHGMAAAFGFGGLIAGVFAPLGRFWCMAAFLLSGMVANVGAPTAIPVFPAVLEAVAAGAVFLLIPRRLLCRISGIFSAARGCPDDGLYESGGAEQLQMAAAALEEVSDTIAQVNHRLSDVENEGFAEVCARAVNTACKKCGMKMYCWGAAYNDTVDVLNGITEIITESGTIEPDDLPAYFKSRCCRLNEFTFEINRAYARFTAKRSAEMHTEQLRGLIGCGIGSAASVLKQVSVELGESAVRARAGEMLRPVFANFGLNLAESFCALDSRGRMSVTAYIDRAKESSINGAELLEMLSDTCGRRFDGPVVQETDSRGRLRMDFTQSAEFAVEFGEAAIQKTGETLCGDSSSTFTDSRGRAVMVLSDGMGCGGAAAVESGLATGLMSRLIKSGFAFETAMQVVNTALMLKAGDELFATMDIASIDLYDGTAAFFKAGAPPAYVRRHGMVERVEQVSMPVGMIHGTSLEKSSVRLSRGDIVVLMSDGALYGDDAWIISRIREYDGKRPKAFARDMAQMAKQQRGDGHDDDITVLTAVIH